MTEGGFPEAWKTADEKVFSKRTNSAEYKELSDVSILSTISKFIERAREMQIHLYLNQSMIVKYVVRLPKTIWRTTTLHIADDIIRATDDGKKSKTNGIVFFGFLLSQRHYEFLSQILKTWLSGIKLLI